MIYAGKWKSRYYCHALFAFVLLIGQNLAVWAYNPIVYGGADLTPVNIWPHCYYYEDREGIKRIEDFTSGQLDSVFFPTDQVPSTFGFKSSVIWLKFVVRPKDQLPVFLTIERVSLWNAQLYKVNADGSYQKEELGVNVPFNERKFKSNYSVTQLTFNNYSEQVFYIRLTTYTSLFIPIYLNSAPSLIERLSQADFFNGIYIGILCFVLLYNIVRLLLRRQRIYAAYILYVLALFLYLGLFNTGLGFEHVWPAQPWLNRHYVVAACLLGLSMIFFSSVFLDTKKELPRYHHFLSVLSVAFMVMIILNLSGFIFETSYTLVWILIPTFFYLLLLGFVSLRKGNKNAWLYLAGWGTFILFYAIFSFWLNGYIGESFLGHKSLFIGSCLEMLFWFSAIADKMKQSEIAQREKEDKLRKEISRDFHDELGNQSARLINYVGLLRIQGAIKDDAFENLSGYAQNILTGAKDFVWALDPRNADLKEVVIHLKDFGEKMFYEKSIGFRFFNDDQVAFKLPGGYNRQLILIFKEAMTNAFKYSSATRVDFGLQKTKTGIEIYLKDDGVGIPLDKLTGSDRGLDNMRYRSARLGCKLSISSTTGHTSVVLLVPYSMRADA